MEMKNCWDCGFYKEYVNHTKMKELDTDKVLYLHVCENSDMPTEINDLEIAEKCNHYDEDSWMK